MLTDRPVHQGRGWGYRITSVADAVAMQDRRSLTEIVSSACSGGSDDASGTISLRLAAFFSRVHLT
jgi:hypothetical protein